MTTRVHHSRSFLGHLFLPVPHDFIARRRRIRTISLVVVIALFSALAAGVILYTSNPTSFSGSTH